MLKGVGCVLAACFLWGLIFVIPQTMPTFSSMEVVLGRYFFYGLISCLICLKTGLKISNPVPVLKKAFYFSFISTFGYYTLVVFALRLAPPAICTLLVGISPICIALYGNFREQEIEYKKLFLPSVLIFVGLITMNISYFHTTSISIYYFVGCLFSLVALVLWCWYVVANYRFLNEHPEINSESWSTIIGLVTIFWVLLVGSILYFTNQLSLERYFHWNDELKGFLFGSACLGFLCSWVGAYLWNKANLYLPVSLAGQFTVFETIFGVLFVYLFNQSMPTMIESIGIFIILFGIIFCIRSYASKIVFE